MGSEMCIRDRVRMKVTVIFYRLTFKALIFGIAKYDILSVISFYFFIGIFYSFSLKERYFDPEGLSDCKSRYLSVKELLLAILFSLQFLSPLC